MNKSFLIQDEDLRDFLAVIVETCGGCVLSSAAVTEYLEILSEYTGVQIRVALLAAVRTMYFHPSPAAILSILKSEFGCEEPVDLRFLSKTQKEALHGNVVASLPVIPKGNRAEGCELVLHLGRPASYIFLDGNDPQTALNIFMNADWSQAMALQ